MILISGPVSVSIALSVLVPRRRYDLNTIPMEFIQENKVVLKGSHDWLHICAMVTLPPQLCFLYLFIYLFVCCLFIYFFYFTFDL